MRVEGARIRPASTSAATAAGSRPQEREAVHSAAVAPVERRQRCRLAARDTRAPARRRLPAGGRRAPEARRVRMVGGCPGIFPRRRQKVPGFARLCRIDARATGEGRRPFAPGSGTPSHPGGPCRGASIDHRRQLGYIAPGGNGHQAIRAHGSRVRAGTAIHNRPSMAIRWRSFPVLPPRSGVRLARDFSTRSCAMPGWRFMFHHARGDFRRCAQCGCAFSATTSCSPSASDFAIYLLFWAVDRLTGRRFHAQRHLVAYRVLRAAAHRWASSSVTGSPTFVLGTVDSQRDWMFSSRGIVSTGLTCRW